MKLPCLAIAIIMTTSCQIIQPRTALKQAYAGDFMVGAALHDPLFKWRHWASLRLASSQFNTITPANAMKWERMHPRPGSFVHREADRIVRFGERHGMHVAGHVLFWHQQTPDWVFTGDNGAPATRDVLLGRMRERVRAVAGRYGSRIHSWDVVNEALLDDGSLRDTPWTRILGGDFIDQAFRIAGEELPPTCALIYNDYDMFQPGKRDAVVGMIHRLRGQGIRIDGVGMQGHWALDGPDVGQIEASITAFANAGVAVHISELDINVLPRYPGMWEPNIGACLKGDSTLDPYRNGLPDDVQQQLATRYGDLFRLFLKHRDKIQRVTFWGVADADSWLNDHPIEGRVNHPLLFDHRLRPKPAFDAVIQAAGDGNRGTRR